MERLTFSGTKEAKNHVTIRQVTDKLATYEDFEEIFREKMTDAACDLLSDKEEFGKWLDRNKWIAKKCDEYARAEKQGLLLRLRCKVGDTIYYIEDNVINEFVVYSFDIRPLQEFVCNYEGTRLNLKNFGKTVFLTQAKAERRLKNMRKMKERYNQ